MSVSVWDRQQVRQYLDGLPTDTVAVAVTATGASTQGLHEAYVQFFGAFGGALGWRHGRSLERQSARDALAGR